MLERSPLGGGLVRVGPVQQDPLDKGAERGQDLALAARFQLLLGRGIDLEVVCVVHIAHLQHRPCRLTDRAAPLSSTRLK